MTLSPDYSDWSRDDLIARLRVLEAREERVSGTITRDQYADLYDFAPVAYLSLTPLGQITAANRTAADWLGGEGGDLIGQSLLGFLASSDVDPFRAYLDDLFRAGAPLSLEVCLGSTSGGWWEVIVDGTLGHAPADDGWEVRVALTDITIRKRAEAERERAQRALRALNATHQAANAATDEDDLLSRVCRFLAGEGGYALAGVLVPEAGNSEAMHVRAAAGRTAYFEQLNDRVLRTPHGNGRGPCARALATGQPAVCSAMAQDPAFAPWREVALAHGLASSVALPLRVNDTWLGMLGVYAEEEAAFGDDELAWLEELAAELATAWDARRVRQDHAALERERDRLIEILERVPDVVGMTDADGRILYRNPGARQLLGDAATGPPQSGLHLDDVHPRWAAELVRKEGLPTAAQEGEWQGETAYLDGQGREVPVSQAIVAHYGPHGSVVRYSSIARDLRGIKQRQAAQNRTRRLMALGELGSALAHQLNQPLAVASTYAEGALLRLQNGPGGNDAELRSALERMVASVQQAGAIVRGVRSFLRGGEPHRRAMDLGDLLRRLVSDLPAITEETAGQCQVYVARDLPLVLADPVLLRECLVNLIQNGNEANRENGVTEGGLAVRADWYGAASEWVEVQVCDRGPGLPPELQTSLDRPLFTTKEEGLGLGLAICRTVVEAHGGQLWATDNAPESGTTFHFTLPVARQDE